MTKTAAVLLALALLGASPSAEARWDDQTIPPLREPNWLGHGPGWFTTFVNDALCASQVGLEQLLSYRDTDREGTPRDALDAHNLIALVEHRCVWAQGEGARYHSLVALFRTREGDTFRIESYWLVDANRLVYVLSQLKMPDLYFRYMLPRSSGGNQ